MTEWTKLVKQVYEKNKKRANYSLGKAMVEAKKIYRGTKKAPGKVLKKVGSVARRTKKGVVNAPRKLKNVVGDIYRGTLKAVPKVTLKGGKKGGTKKNGGNKKGGNKKGGNKKGGNKFCSSSAKYQGGSGLDDLKSKFGLKGGAVDSTASSVDGGNTSVDTIPQGEGGQNIEVTAPGTAPVVSEGGNETAE